VKFSLKIHDEIVSEIVVIIGRVFAGLGVRMASMTTPLFISDASPARIRGAFVSSPSHSPPALHLTNITNNPSINFALAGHNMISEAL
jgi:hypothetical protein